MGIYLNQDNLSFRQSLNSEIYVDKSGIISLTNSCINTRDKYVCISRPRRFGKSMTAEMLCAYYSRGSESGELFAGLKIASDGSFAEHLNRYNVVHLNMADFSSKGKNIEEKIDYISKCILRDLKKEFPGSGCSDWSDLNDVLKVVFDETRIPFVFIIDEWDSIFREHENDTAAQKYYLDFLRALLKDQAYVGLAYMTGILPIKKYGVHSALNMFTEISMIDTERYAEFTGFTGSEVEELCSKYSMPIEEIRKWYDGYEVNGIKVFNPRSVVRSMMSHKLGSYWTSTETYDALKKYIEMNMDGLRDKVIAMISGDRVRVNTRKFQNDMSTFNSSDDVLTLLIHLGYLTYDAAREECYIPNKEVMDEFMNCIEDRGWEPVMAAINASESLLGYTLSKDTSKVAEEIDRVHEESTSLINYNDENSLAMVISLAYYTARNSYFMLREQPAGKGFADIIFLPRHDNPNPPIVVELKFDKSAEGAIEQIKERNYKNAVSNLSEYRGEIICVGINYDKSTKQHTCAIETVVQ